MINIGLDFKNVELSVRGGSVGGVSGFTGLTCQHCTLTCLCSTTVLPLICSCSVQLLSRWNIFLSFAGNRHL